LENVAVLGECCGCGKRIGTDHHGKTSFEHGTSLKKISDGRGGNIGIITSKSHKIQGGVEI
jgi:hypothetical protein